MSDPRSNAFVNFVEVRRDGRLIPEGMALEDVFAWGKPERIVEVRWDCAGRWVQVTGDEGMLAAFPGGRRSLAVIFREQGVEGVRLSIFGEDGAEIRRIPTPTLLGRDYRFGWFENLSAWAPDEFEVVLLGGPDRRACYNAGSGEMIGHWEWR